MNEQQFLKLLQELKSTKDWWDYASSIITVITSILTLLIAFRLFERFSFKRQILQKQLDTLFRLINILQAWTIEIYGKGLDNDSNSSHGYRIKFFDFRFDKENPNYRPLFIHKRLLFTQDWEEQNPLLSWDSNPFLPKSIAEKIEKFKITFPYPVNLSDIESEFVVDLDNFDKSITRRERDFHCFIHNPDDICCKDFASFHKICNELITEIENWLRKYDANELNLK